LAGADHNEHSSKNDAIDTLVEKIVDLTPPQLEKVNNYIDKMIQVDDFSSPVLSKQEKQTLSKMFKI
ncbi:hypothetical protein, partial [Vibrio sp.]